MEGTPQLLTDVKFTQLRKGGYDPEEVDNYLERINEAVAKLADNLRSATERAEAAQSQLADARRAQAEAEAELEVIRSGEGGAPADEQLAKVLVLAQRAADQAIDEANASATKTLADARAKSVNLLAEAEQERERLLVKAHKKADAVAEERARTLQTQVTELETARNDLAADVEVLQSFLDDERDRLRNRVESIRSALDEPEGLRLAAAPELRDPPIPVLELARDREALSPFVGAGDRESDDRPTQAMDVVGEDLLDDPAHLGDEPPAPDTDAFGGPDADDGGGGSDGDWSDAADPTALDDEDDDEEDDPFVTPEVEGIDGIDDGGWKAPSGADTIDLDQPALASDGPDANDTDSHLFGSARRDPVSGSAGSSPGRRGDLFPADSADESELGEPDEEADAAMRAFFERDLDDPAASRSRFGRRR